MNRLTLNDLEQRIRERATAGAEESYTRTLLDRGVAHCARKLGEESLETVLAAVAEDRARLVAESADLLYHLLVLLHARGIALSEVEAELWQRRGKSRLGPKINSSTP